MTDARDWIRRWGPDLTIQARLAESLLDSVEADTRWDWLELGCSIADGRGDRWSDLDIALGHVGEASPPRDEVDSMLRGLDAVVDLSAAPWNVRGPTCSVCGRRGRRSTIPSTA